ncbi:MAG: hypothetical protein KatS3mg056_3677 [Chloroflexus sp.]|nr:MAG: hypothetical protein KatS3mg056_3677 [Chloroflexus sp.]
MRHTFSPARPLGVQAGFDLRSPTELQERTKNMS